MGAKNAGSSPIANTAMSFKRGHACNVSAVIGTLVVIATSMALRRSIMVLASDGVEGYS